ncbi:MAG: Asp-tRNA(Asn)/Glu-tRNA(Gln) amidotransferase subunit GatC [Oscillospiraceae bacterium]
MDINIKHIAKLARLSIPEDKVAKFESEMVDIIKMVENLPELPAGGALVDVNNTMELRKDEIVPSCSRADMLMNSPKTAAGCILIPRVVD